MIQTKPLENEISLLLLPIAIHHFSIKECHSLRNKTHLMPLQKDQAIVIVIRILSTSHGERRRCSQCILDERMGRVLMSSFWMTTINFYPDTNWSVMLFIRYIYFL